ncbi:3alpha(or 20beta)-hydroxysteroid dehydrogenase [Haloechinothrix alba]|uniref:3alpha(Or 20beta)-hydroxysteroid dehydrogenase n=1 Tax=Haloechinothrix alba TaxID=664784 RepID=A0A239A115_9PSEU|nr:glucose 1-dehydrogenase [Haloechinothrix alba]SNR89345.1 3alpha(or 20beta)-hydroxysteroid dehydrogenase [Haloechinothrix alba]
MSRLAGRTTLITGAARGQGAAAARRVVDEGGRVMITDVADAEGKELAASLGEAAAFTHLDVTSEQGWQEAVRATVEHFGGLDVLVNNAGMLRFRELEHTTLGEYEQIVSINQVGTFLGMRSVIAEMERSGGGSIVNVSSVEGLAGMPQVAAYTASKFAIRGMTKVAALELGSKGIRVNSVHPGLIDTGMIGDAMGGADLDLAPAGNLVALGRIGEPAEIAALVAFLASDDSSYCTGSEFVADGGSTAAHGLNRPRYGVTGS